MTEIVKNLARGFLMGSADIVPGVSGGTVALVVGIYTRLIDSISDGARALGHLAKADVAGAKDRLSRVDWMLLIPLLAGIALALVSLSSILERLLAERPVELAGLFVGLVGASVIIAWGLVKDRTWVHYALAAAMTVAMYLLLGLRETTSVHDASQGAGPAAITFFGAGALAICAMILPGISGSFILVLLGMYGWALAAVNDRDFVALVSLAAGCAVGLALFSQVLDWALEHHYNTVMAALVGLMVGSMRVLWPWPQGVDSTALEAPSGPVLVPIVLAAVAFGAVMGFERLASKFSDEPTAEPAMMAR